MSSPVVTVHQKLGISEMSRFSVQSILIKFAAVVINDDDWWHDKLAEEDVKWMSG